MSDYDAEVVLADALLTGALDRALGMMLSLAKTAKDEEVRREALMLIQQAAYVPGFGDPELIVRWADEFDRRTQHDRD